MIGGVSALSMRLGEVRNKSVYHVPNMMNVDRKFDNCVKLTQAIGYVLGCTNDSRVKELKRKIWCARHKKDDYNAVVELLNLVHEIQNPQSTVSAQQHFGMTWAPVRTDVDHVGGVALLTTDNGLSVLLGLPQGYKSKKPCDRLKEALRANFETSTSSTKQSGPNIDYKLMVFTNRPNEKTRKEHYKRWAKAQAAKALEEEDVGFLDF